MSSSTEPSPPPYAKEDPEELETPQEEPVPTTTQPAVPAPVILQEKPDFPPPAYTEKPVIITDDVTETSRSQSEHESVVSPLLWLAVILSILMFSPCGYVAFAFTCFAFWTETGGNLAAARYLSSVARICAFVSFMMGLIILLSPHMTDADRKPYCLFEEEKYRICI